MRIAISGAGVAGTALAHWLHRTGHTPTVIEQAPAFRTGGYMIDFWGAGYTVAGRMGLEESIRDAGYDMESVRSVDTDGRVLATLETNAFRHMIGDDFTSIPRGDLAAAIHATIAEDVEMIYGDAITAIDEHPDGVGLTFGHAGPREFDLVIGADGLHSNVRRLVFGPDSEFEYYLGCKVAAGVVEGYRPRDELAYVTYALPGRQAARVALRGDRTLILLVFRDVSPGITSDPKAQLHNLFDDAGWECPQLLAALDAGDPADLYFDVVSQVRMERWSRGRVLLIGDAAGCISLLGGEGTGLAITEAYVLAGELQRAGGDHSRAFAAYESLLRPFIEAKQSGARNSLGFFATRTRFGLRFRNMAMRAMNLRMLTNLFAGTVRDDFELPDYRL
ncbi:FAD-binding domain [[Mycobacterium] nativiensis]|uniref:FAD-binding domain n=1 Tax=[Mycobacterium] nativiensis TaxID=2855503 RepID=A0ABU5XXB8_9MYCO|nr:FAD-binding domain [Mycolicibacter sp. MYC340]MEB3032568.1 FAD-binding domain [Mycolicibacter sp. MYC340]